jgi:magnesium chelatase family protein
MDNKEIKEFCVLNENCVKLLWLAVIKMNLSARSYNRTIKLARTIADLEGLTKINSNHIAEALQYRPRNDMI